MCIILQNITHLHPNKTVLFQNINFTVSEHDKVAVVGNNGTGKSTLLQIISGKIQPASGAVNTSQNVYYIPQHYGQYNHLCVSEALGVHQKILSLYKILEGDNSPENWVLLNDDWEIEKKCMEALSFWNLPKIELNDTLKHFSSGEKTRIFLAGIRLNNPGIILLDEPTNHLDSNNRELLYQYFVMDSTTKVVVSHDRALLELVYKTYELSNKGIKLYGGNFSFYKSQKEQENVAIIHRIEHKEKELSKAKKIKQESVERKQRMDNRGNKKHLKKNTPRSLINKLKNDAETSSSKLNDIHSKKIDKISSEMSTLRSSVINDKSMKLNLRNSQLHYGKILINAKKISFSYSERKLWKSPLTLTIRSGERINIKGSNGSGKTTLVKIILGKLKPQTGVLNSYISNPLYIDQEYSLINNELNVYEQALAYNFDSLQEHEIKIRLTRFLFHADFWDKSCGNLSGGEKMRLILCCLMISNKSPDMFILDEPTNNLDIRNSEILTSAIKDYSGTLIIISHDSWFLKESGITHTINLEDFKIE